MSRRPEAVRAALAAAAARTAVAAPGPGAPPAAAPLTWRDLLFDADGGFSRAGDPDRALLAAVAQEYTELDRHGDTLAARAHLDWLERVLGIPRLPVLPDRVVAHATVDPALAPAVVARGTVLRGGKDAAGRERRYTTTAPLTAHGAAVAGVRSTVPGGHPDGTPGVVAAEPFPVDPAAGADAPHTLRLHSPVLAFDGRADGGTMTVRVTFAGAGTLPAEVQHLLWRYPTLDGGVEESPSGARSGSSVSVTLNGSCGVPQGGVPWLELVVPAHRPVPTGLAFDDVLVKVTARSSFVPQAAYLNDGLLDVQKEFEPFGAVAKRGDALYVRSDEAFAKPLATVSVSVQVMPDGDDGPVLTEAGNVVVGSYQGSLLTMLGYLSSAWGDSPPVEVQGAYSSIGGLISATTQPKVVWQHRTDGRWRTFKDVGASLTGFGHTGIGGPVASEEAVVGGEAGHHIRAFLAAGDFGWTKYQRDVAAFATAAAAQTGTVPPMPVPPTPPVVSRLTISYTSAEVSAEEVVAVNGWARRVRTGTGRFSPFTRTVSQEGDTGMVALGLDLPDGVTGSSVSVHVGVTSAAPCGSSADPLARWEWWGGTGWHRLAVADGTRLLRESGLLRFVAPAGWVEGCPDADATTGRWVRMVTSAPERIGVITSVTPDAVLADFASAAADPSTDPSPDTALPPGTIKGTLSPVPGVKKVTNLAGVRGRGPEGDAAYRRRASALARHRGRAVTAWDVEELVAVRFPEVAAVRCLPHTAADGTRAPGSVGVVVVPDDPHDPAPRPSVSLAGRLTDALAPLAPVHATPVVMCALYVPVTLDVRVLLRPGVAALTGSADIAAALRAWLHPTGEAPTRWGRALYRSSLEAFLERLPAVDALEALSVRDGTGADVGTVEVDVCRGLFCSSEQHTIDAREQL